MELDIIQQKMSALHWDIERFKFESDLISELQSEYDQLLIIKNREIAMANKNFK